MLQVAVPISLQNLEIWGKNGTLVSLSATGKAQKGRKFFVVLLMCS
jgi:hypothetical protein